MSKASSTTLAHPAFYPPSYVAETKKHTDAQHGILEEAIP